MGLVKLGQRRHEDPGEHVAVQSYAGGGGSAERRIEQIVAQMDELNAAEEQEHGDDDGGGGLPEELQLRERRRERIRAAREQLEREKGEKLEAKHQKSFADPEANMMKTEGSLQYLQRAAGDE